MRKPTMSVNQTIPRRATAMAAALVVALGIIQAQASSTTTTITFTPTTYTLNPEFLGFSYEKDYIHNALFNSNNVALINCFTQAGDSGVLRLGGSSVDSSGWNSENGLAPIVEADVDRLAGFMNALPPGWKVIYGINFRTNNVSSVAAEASYAALRLGSRLQAFEIGNEPENYGMSESAFTTQWTTYKAQAKKYGPVEGPDSGGNTTWTRDFAASQDSVIVLLTQHYYAGDANSYQGNPSGAMTKILTPDTGLPSNVSGDVSAAYQHNIPLGFRFDECGSLSHGGLAGVSDAFGASLWTLDFMFTVARYNGQGVNYHGGSNSPYTPIVDNHTDVTGVGPELYGMKLFSFLPAGSPAAGSYSVVPPNFTANGIKLANGTYAAVLNNKDASNTVVATVNVGSGVTTMSMMGLQCSGGLFSTTGFTVGGQAIHPNGTWTGSWQWQLTASGGQVTVTVPPATAFLMVPNN
jgi:hypothetical protein